MYAPDTTLIPWIVLGIVITSFAVYVWDFRPEIKAAIEAWRRGRGNDTH